MRRPLTRRRILVFVIALALFAALPLAILAATGTFSGSLERQAARWTTSNASTSSTNWRNVPRLALTRCTVDQVTVMVSVSVRGAPVLFRVIIDGVPEAPLRPGFARFVPSGTETFSATFVGNTAPFEADDTHRFNVQWRSPSGGTVTLDRGVLDLLFERGDQGC